MNIHAPLDDRAYVPRIWWVMLAGCATRFSADRSGAAALGGFALCATILLACRVARVREGRRQFTAYLVAIIGLCAFLLQLNRAGLLSALLALLFAIEVAMFVIASKRLHAWLILAATLCAVLFAAAESRSSWFLPCAIWFTFASLSLLALDQRRDRERMMPLQSAGAVTQRTGGAAFSLIAVLLTIPLYLFAPKPAGLMFGGLQATSPHDDRASRNDSAAQSSEPRTQPELPEDSERNASSAPAPAESPLPLQDEAPARPEQGTYGDTFAVDEVQRTKSRGNAIVAYVKSSRPINLRGLVYERFENHRWHRDALPFKDFELDGGNLEINAQSHGIEPVQQSVEIVRDLDATLNHAPGVRRVRFPGPSLRRYEDDVIVAPQPLRAQTTYSLMSTLEFNGGRYSLDASSRTELARYLMLAGVSQRVRALAAEVTSGNVDARSKAIALESFLRTRYEYSYETIPQQGYTPLDAFLFDSRRGHCEYFASALAIMLRAVGIPSRVVTGFSLAAPNPVTGFYEVRAFDGHAWVEAYLDGRWVMLEPTPFYPLPRPGESSQIADQLDGYLSRLAQTGEVFDPGSLKTSIARTARDSWQVIRQAMQLISNTLGALGWLLPATLILGAMASAAAYLALMAAADWFDNRALRVVLVRARGADSKRATLMTAQALQGACAPRGVERHAGASFREYLAALRDAGCIVPAHFADEFDAARYGSSGDIEATAVDDVSRIVAAHIDADRWPRTRRTAGAWRRRLREAIAR